MCSWLYLSDNKPNSGKIVMQVDGCCCCCCCFDFSFDRVCVLVSEECRNFLIRTAVVYGYEREREERKEREEHTRIHTYIQHIYILTCIFLY